MEYDNKLDIAIQRDYKVVKANDLVRRARYDLNLTELKVFAYVLSKIKPNDTEGQEYVFNVKDYCQVCGLDYKNGGNYNHIKSALKNLRDKSFWMIDENGREVTVGWLSKAKIERSSGKIVVKLDEDIQKYVIQLYNNYTQYSLLSTLPMTSSYSFRMYELLQSYAFTKEHTFDIDDLKRQVGATQYSNFKDFRRKVMEISTREINNFTDLEIMWEPITKGKKVIQVKFYINKRDSWGQYEASKRATKQIDGQISMFDAGDGSLNYIKMNN